MKTSRCIKYALILLFAVFSLNQAVAQPEDYIIVNKTNCTAQVTAYCTDNSFASNTMPADTDWQNSCPAGETLCYVKMTLPGSTTIYATDVALVCLNPGIILPSNACYTQNLQWDTIAAHVVCNIY